MITDNIPLVVKETVKILKVVKDTIKVLKRNLCRANLNLFLHLNFRISKRKNESFRREVLIFKYTV